jgi:hypothetical protein
VSPAPHADVMLRKAGARAIKLRKKARKAVTEASHHHEFLARVDVEFVKEPLE